MGTSVFEFLAVNGSLYEDRTALSESISDKVVSAAADVDHKAIRLTKVDLHVVADRAHHADGSCRAADCN